LSGCRPSRLTGLDFNVVAPFVSTVLGAGAIVVRYRLVTMGFAMAALALAGVLLSQMGSEFMPRLDEGSILIESRKLPGVSVTQSVALSTQVENVLMKGFPEISSVVTKIGRPDLATEAMGVHQGDIYVLLKPRSEWKRFGRSKPQLIEAIDKSMGGPGSAGAAWSWRGVSWPARTRR